MSSVQTLKHFGHPHRLQISAYQETENEQPSCSACKRAPTGWICMCKDCDDYLIHFQCSQVPNQIRHPFHKDHILSLVSRSEDYICDACNKIVDGFSYSCRKCKIDIHILCATMPQLVSHISHQHPLDLVFSLPYEDDSFHCAICQGIGSNHWHYHCKQCKFDAHLGCATPEPTIAGSSSSTRTAKASKKQESTNSTPIREQNLYPGSEKKGVSTSTQGIGKKEQTKSNQWKESFSSSPSPMSYSSKEKKGSFVPTPSSNERKEAYAPNLSTEKKESSGPAMSKEKTEGTSPAPSKGKKESFVSTPTKENKDASGPTLTNERKEASRPNLTTEKKENPGLAMSKEKKESFVSTPTKESKDASGPTLTNERKEASRPNLTTEKKENPGLAMSKEKKEEYTKNKKGRHDDDEDEDLDYDDDNDDDVDDDGKSIWRRRKHKHDEDEDDDDDDKENDDDNDDDDDGAMRKHKDDNEDDNEDDD